MVSLTKKIESLTSSNQLQASQIQSLGTRGTWCAYKDYWNKVGIISYDRLTFRSTNMHITRVPLNTNTGDFNHKCKYWIFYSSHFRDLHCAHVWSLAGELQPVCLLWR